jgi:hypothetical protein
MRLSYKNSIGKSDRTKSIKSYNILKLVFKMLKAEGLFLHTQKN